MKRYQFDLLLSEQELEEIINSLSGVVPEEESDLRTTLAKRLEHTRSHFFHKAKSREKA